MTPAHCHRKDIEGLRALAIGLVLLYHAQLQAFGGGFIGVDVFFVVSGFLITRSLVGELERRGTISLGAFYARRIRRLLPAAALMLVATSLATRALLPPTAWRDIGGDIAAAAAYAVNWRLALREVDYLAEDAAVSPVLHCWSLAIEEQFYLVWPLLLLAGAAVARGRARPLRPVLAIVLAALVVGPSLLWWAVRSASRPELAFFDTGVRMWELAAGGLVALAPPGPALSPHARALLKATALAALVGLGVAVEDAHPWPTLAALGAVGPTALLIALGGRGDDAVEHALSLPPLQRIGAWSYSLYLWHWPPLALLSARWGGLSTPEAAAVVALSSVPAVLSHSLVENPIRFAPRLRASTPLSLSLGANLSLLALLAGSLVALSLPGGGGTLVLAAKPAGSARGTAVGAGVLSPRPLGSHDEEQIVASLATVAGITPAPAFATSDLPRVYRDRCHVDGDTAAPRVCRYGDPAGAVHVALVGDSKAGQWGDALEAIGLRRGWRLTYLLKSHCELSTALAEVEGAPDPTCRAWGQAVLDLLAADPPRLVITSQVSNTAWSDGSDAEKRERLVSGMLEAYARLRRAGSEVAILVDNAHPGMKVHECVSQHLDDLVACAFARDPERGGRPAQLAVAERGGYAVIDLDDYVCPGAICPPVIGNVLVYRQGSHLTRTYVATLTGVLEERLVPLVESATLARTPRVGKGDERRLP